MTLILSSLTEAVETGARLSGDSPRLLTEFGEMQTHGKKGHWLVSPLRRGHTILAAARAILSAPTIQWCETHRSVRHEGDSACHRGSHIIGASNCSIKPALILYTEAT